MSTQKLFEAGLAAHKAERLDDAEKIYQNVLASAPEHFDANHCLGILRMQRRDHAGALPLLRKANLLRPLDFACNANLGNALRELGDTRGALESFNRAVDAQPSVVAARLDRGNTLLDLGRADEAMRDFMRAIELEPDNFACNSDLGNALTQMRQADAALPYLEKAMRLAPDAPVPKNNLGNALLALQRPASALAHLREALARDPHYVDALHNCGCALQDLGQMSDAQRYFERAIELSPSYVKSMINLGIVHRRLRAHEESARCFQRVLQLAPERPHALGSWVASLRHACSWRELEDLEARLLAEITQGRPAADPGELIAICDSPALLLSSARQYAQSELNAVAPDPAGFAARSSDRLKIAYLSADFHEHATAYLMAELFERHDRSKFEVTAISCGKPDASPMRLRLERAFDRFVDVHQFSDSDIADVIRREGIQLLVELNGLAMGNRMRVLARRCAPIQISYLGFPGTTGTDFIDYLIADRIVVPEEARCWYTEHIVYLPDSYQVNDTRREISQHPLTRADVGLPERSFVYCCFNGSYKISPATFATWMWILQRAPDSVLWLLDDNAAATRNLKDEARRHGVAPERLVFAPRIEAARHIARYRLADLFLDTLPCGAHTTASEALWAGLPVLTCLGKTFAGRVAASLVTAVGMPEFVVDTLQAYKSRALDFAQSPRPLLEIRHRLAENARASPLFDIERFRRHLESAYESMWQRRMRGEPPVGFAVG